MRKILILIGLCLTLYASGQGGVVLSGVVAGQGVSAAGGSSTPPLFLTSDGYTEGWYSAEEANVTKDGSDYVSDWDDLSSNDYDLTQAVGTNQPLWSASGITFDGVDNFLQTTAYTLAQPCFIYVVMKQITYTANEYYFRDPGGVNLLIAAPSGGSSPAIALYSGSTLTPNNNLAVDTWGIIRALFNGANSSLQVDATAALTGNAGADGSTTGISIGSYNSFAHCIIVELIVRSKDDNADGDDEDVYTYLKNKYGL